MQIQCLQGVLLSFSTLLLLTRGQSKTSTYHWVFLNKLFFNKYFTIIQEELDGEEEASRHSDASSESGKEDENSAKEETDDEENEEISESISI